MGYRGIVDTTSDRGPTPADADSIEAIAAAWLAAEQELAAGSGNPAQSEINARALSDRYDDAIRAASREDLRLAWEAARKIQGEQEMGSEAWANARRVSELLRDEYQAADPEQARRPGRLTITPRSAARPFRVLARATNGPFGTGGPAGAAGQTRTNSV